MPSLQFRTRQHLKYCVVCKNGTDCNGILKLRKEYEDSVNPPKMYDIKKLFPIDNRQDDIDLAFIFAVAERKAL